MEQSNKTIFCDIDGTILRHRSPTKTGQPVTSSDGVYDPYIVETSMTGAPVSGKLVLPGTINKISEWISKGYKIIFTTGRCESQRQLTIKELEHIGIPYDQLVMGVGRGMRVLINDKKPNGDITAMSFNIDRNEGIENINI
jgi:ribonucleotide monophosphatase NagD (HAD superfamily)